MTIGRCITSIPARITMVGLMGKRYVAIVAILIALTAGAYVTVFGWPWVARETNILHDRRRKLAS